MRNRGLIEQLHLHLGPWCGNVVCALCDDSASSDLPMVQGIRGSTVAMVVEGSTPVSVPRRPVTTAPGCAMCHTTGSHGWGCTLGHVVRAAAIGGTDLDVLKKFPVCMSAGRDPVVDSDSASDVQRCWAHPSWWATALARRGKFLLASQLQAPQQTARHPAPQRLRKQQQQQQLQQQPVRRGGVG